MRKISNDELKLIADRCHKKAIIRAWGELLKGALLLAQIPRDRIMERSALEKELEALRKNIREMIKLESAAHD